MLVKKIQNLVKNKNFGLKKIEILVKKIKILVKNRNFG